MVASGVGCRESLPCVSSSVGRGCCGMVEVWCLGGLVDANHQKAHEADKCCLSVALERLPQTVLLCSLLWVSCVGAWLLVFVWMV